MSGPAGEQRLLILGTGSIARHHAERFAQMPGCQLVAAVDTFDERARDFAAAFQIPVAFGSLKEAIAWGEFDAAVNSTPDGVHKATTLELIAAGKPVFCEKPLAVNYPDAEERHPLPDRAPLRRQRRARLPPRRQGAEAPRPRVRLRRRRPDAGSGMMARRVSSLPDVSASFPAAGSSGD